MASVLAGCDSGTDYVNFQGTALGTTYSITYRTPAGAPSDFSSRITRVTGQCLDKINHSFSIYNNHSLLSKLNHNLTLGTDSLFRIVFKRSQEISIHTDGAFDISAAPFFDYWGFGSEKRDSLKKWDPEAIKEYTGMDKFCLEDTLLNKKDPRCSLNMNAIAKGYACDLVADSLSRLGITDLLVEIGGEIVCKGLNPDRKPWRIGIDSPVDGNVHPGESIEVVISLTNKALATSGNYRNYYMLNGKKYAHIIDPRTGMPVLHHLLSATVIADDCMSADAYATAFMVMGLEPSKSFLNKNPNLGAYLIYDENGTFKTYTTNNIQTGL
ncbi:MAG TPA: FAD:protein FMN transferase [Bacteroidales bacterium]|nr:FAD:protein FMN transferase [Bacteroidales bacterium]